MDLYKEELRKERYEKMYNYLYEFEKKGIPIYVRGYKFPAEICARILTCHEDETYMEDRIYRDENLNVIEMLNFDMVVSV